MDGRRTGLSSGAFGQNNGNCIISVWPFPLLNLIPILLPAESARDGRGIPAEWVVLSQKGMGKVSCQSRQDAGTPALLVKSAEAGGACQGTRIRLLSLSEFVSLAKD